VTTKRRYHFLKACHAIDDLKQKRIKLSVFGDVNDKEELGACYFPGYEHNLPALKTSLKATFRFLCLAPDPSSQHMWELYGDKGHGICFGLEVNEDQVSSVSYVPEKIAIDLPSDLKEQIIRKRHENHGQVSDFEKQFAAKIKPVLLTKFECWHTEHEERAFFSNQASRVGKFYFAYFDHDLYIREVILGKHCCNTEGKIADLVKGYSGQRISIGRNQSTRL